MKIPGLFQISETDIEIRQKKSAAGFYFH